MAIGLALTGCEGVQRAASTPTTSPVVPAVATQTGSGVAGKPGVRGATLRQTFEGFPDSGDKPAVLRLLVENGEAWAERWRLLKEANSTLDVNYFILHEDVFGVAFLGHLLKKAEEGVRIRILLDGFGTKMSWSPSGNDYLDELANAGDVTIKLYRPRLMRYVEALMALDPAVAVSSEHDKIIVADGRSSLIGGRNIAAEYFASPADQRHVFHDTDVRIDSKSASVALTRAFEVEYESDDAVEAGGEAVNLVSQRTELLAAYEAMDGWLREPPIDDPPEAKSAAKPREGPPDRDRSEVELGDADDDLEKLPRLRGALRRERPRSFSAETRVIDSLPRAGEPDDPITRALVQLVGSSRKKILIQSPYLVLSEAGAEVFAAAGRRGVEITILTNSPVSSDNALSQAFFLEQWPELLARVPNLRLFVGGREMTLHDKVAVFDDTLATIGTYNLDPTSMALNSEVVAAVWSPAFARTVAVEPKRLISAGAPNVYEYRIERDAAGNALRRPNGSVRVAFGPRDHCTPEEWASLGAYWTMLKAAKFVGLSPLL